MLGAKPLRNAAATARYLLLQLAAQRWASPLEQLQVHDGIVSVQGDASEERLLREIWPERRFERRAQGFRRWLCAERGRLGKPKDPANYTVVGKPLPRVDIAPKILGQWQYVTDVRVPGMLHGRVMRPAGVGAKLVSVDDAPAKAIPAT